jgi:LysR family transcriptional regulator, carnitine catabolism transcriptional activator
MPTHKKPLSLRSLPSLRQLRAFVAIYQTGQVSAAADQLALTQPAVTVLLREFEARLGISLFDRTPRGLRRTDAATEAMAFVERILADLEGLGENMGEMAAARRGRVRVGCTSTIAQTLLPPLIREFSQAHPLIELEIVDIAPVDFVETLLGHRFDVGIGTLDHSVSGIEEEVFLRDTLSAVGVPGQDFAASGPITWKQLASLPLITVKPGYGVRRRIDNAAREAGVELRIVHEVSLLMTAIALAEAGVGVAVVPGSLLLHASGSRVVARRVVRPMVERNIALLSVTERYLSPAAQAFRKLVIASTRRNG